MSAHLSEEEQLERLKGWWKEYGKTIVVVILLSVGGYFGWTTYQDQQQQRAENASALYQEMQQLTGEQQTPALGEEQKDRLAELAVEIKELQPDSFYAHAAAFSLAQLAVNDGNLEAAESELRWVLDQRSRATTEHTARLRLARVLKAQGRYDEALALVEEVPESAFAVNREEVRGDILLASGDVEGAFSAYEKALNALGGGQQQREMLLQMKLDEVQAASATEPATEENAS